MPKKKILYVIIAICLICISCENPKAPVWNTNINFPLLNTEYSFAEMLTNDNPFQEDSLTNIISIVFEDDILKQSDSLGVDKNYFLTPEFSLDDLSISENLSLAIPSIDINYNIPLDDNLIDLTAFSNLGDVCIPISSIQTTLDNSSYQEVIPFNDLNQLTSELLEQYNYITIDEATIQLVLDDSQFPFPINAEYEIKGYENDVLFNNQTDNLIQMSRVGEQIVFDYSINVEETSNVHEECASLYNQVACEQLGNLWLNNECMPNLNLNNQETCEIAGGNWIGNQCYSNIGCLNLEDCCTLINGIWDGIQCNPEMDGWIYNSNDFYDIEFDISLDIQSIESISGITKSIEFSDTISTPLVNNFIDILGGEVSSSIINPDLGAINLLKFNVENNYVLPIGVSIELLNFKLDDLYINISDTINPNNAFLFNKSIASSEILYYPEFDDDSEIMPIDSIYMNINFECLSDSGNFNYDLLSNINFDISNIMIEPIEFNYLNAVVDTISLETPSLIIDNIPSGFQGVLFSEPSLIIDISNEISINNTLNLNIEAIDEETQNQTLNINANINYPENNGDIANTCIKLDANSTFVYNGNCDEFPIECTIINECTQNINDDFSLDDLLENSPDRLNVFGEALINGKGTLFPDKYVWGDFKLVAPFSIILGDMEVDANFLDTLFTGLNIIPAQSSVVQSINEETKNTIDSSLVNASIISNVINHTPVAGNVSLLISSNEEFFPLFVDELIPEEDICNYDSCFYYSQDQTLINIKEKLNLFYNQDELGVGFINSIDSILYLPMSNSDNRMQHLKFYSANDSLWIGRLIDFELPYAEIDDSGNVVNPGESTSSSFIGPIQIDMINKSDLSQRYINSFISITSTYDLDGNGIIDINEDGIVNLHSFDYINISSYVSFLLNSGGF